MKSLDSTVKPPMSKKQKVKGFSGKVQVPLVGLGVCKTLPSRCSSPTAMALATTTRSDTLTGSGKCK